MSFLLSKILWIFTAPLHLFALVLFAASLFAGYGSGLRKIWGRRVVVGLSLFLVLMIGVPVGDFLLRPLENRFPREIPAKVDGIIVLAGDENPALTLAHDYPALGDTAERYVAFATLARAYPQAQLVFTGGTGSLRPKAGEVSFGEIARRALGGLGIDPARIIFESESRNTFENAQASAAMTKAAFSKEGKNPDLSAGNWLLVTSAFHMPRSMACFRRAGWRVFAAPTDFKATGFDEGFPRFNLVRNLNMMTIALREYIGLVAYWAMGRIDGVWS